MKKTALTYEDLDGAVFACGFVEAGAGGDTTGDFEEDETRAGRARVPLIRARDIVRGGGVVLVLTRAELQELSFAAGNSTSDPDWITQHAKNRNALLSVANKVGFDVAAWGRGSKRRSYK